MGSSFWLLPTGRDESQYTGAIGRMRAEYSVPMTGEKKQVKQVYSSPDTWTYRTVKPLTEKARQANSKDNLMARGKHRKSNNINQDYLGSSEPKSPTKANTGYLNTPEKQDLDLKSHFIMMMEDFKKVINNSLKEIQDNTSKQLPYSSPWCACRFGGWNRWMTNRLSSRSCWEWARRFPCRKKSP